MRGVNQTLFDGEHVVSSSVSGPVREIKVPAGWRAVNVDAAEGQRCPGTTGFGWRRCLQKIDRPIAYDTQLAILFHKCSRFFINRDGPRILRLAVLTQARQEYQCAAKAVACNKVRIGNHVLHVRHFEESSGQRHMPIKRIAQHVLRNATVMQSRECELAQNGKAGAGAADRLRGGDVSVERILHRSALPEFDVASLVSASDKNGFSVPDDVGHLGISGCLAVWDDK